MNTLARARLWLILFGGVAAFVVILATNGRWPALTQPLLGHDLDQHRINSALPALQDGLSIQQDFVPGHNGLTSLSIVLVRYDGEADFENGRLTLSLQDESGQLIHNASYEVAHLEHNQTLTLRFPPIPDSRHHRYTLQLSGDTDSHFSAWGYDLDVYEAGQITLSDPNVFTFAKDLRFTTEYQLTWAEAGRLLTNRLRQDGAIILLALFVLPLPGALALLLYSPSRRWDWAARWGTAVALGAALWPLIWHFTTLVGIRWNSIGLWVVVLAGWGGYLWRWTSRRGRESRGRAYRAHSSSQTSMQMLLLLVLAAGLALRLLAVRDIVFPLWVDSSRHALITTVMVQKGQVLTNYHPLLDIDHFPYHFGFHTLSTTLMMMGGFRLERLLLVFGQLLNALVPLSIYSSVYFITRRRGTAVFAAFLTAFPFYFPGYYATWGRFTQLTGMLIMPLLLVLTWQVVRGGRQWRQAWWLVSFLAAGLFLVHFRVFLLYLPFAILVWLVGWRKNSRWLEMAGAVAAALVASRAFTLWRLNQSTFSSANVPIENYNSFPTAYFTAGWDQQMIWAAAGLVPFIILGWVSWRRWGYFPSILLAWTAVLFGLVGGDIFGLSARSLINLNSMYITLFVPLSLLLGILLDQLSRLSGRWPPWAQRPLWISFGALCSVLLIFGMRLQINILNPATQLARPADIAALAWIAANIPAESTFAVGSRLWLGNTWTGQDGGAWILPLTGRQSSTPPADYIYDPALLQQVNSFNEAAAAVGNWSDPQTAVWLREHGISHIFIGAGGSYFDPSLVAQNLNMTLIYSHDGAFVFEIRDPN